MAVQPISMPQFAHTVCVERWAHSQTHGMNWWAKMTHLSKNKLTSKSTDSSLTWIHSDREGAHKRIKAFRLLLTYELIMVMPFLIQSEPLFPTLYGPDLSHCTLTAPLTLEDQRGPVCFVSARYAFTATTRDILSSRIYVSWLKPAPHGETVVVSCLYLSLSISGAVHQVHCGDLTGMN